MIGLVHFIVPPACQNIQHISHYRLSQRQGLLIKSGRVKRTLLPFGVLDKSAHCCYFKTKSHCDPSTKNIRGFCSQVASRHGLVPIKDDSRAKESENLPTQLLTESRHSVRSPTCHFDKVKLVLQLPSKATDFNLSFRIISDQIFKVRDSLWCSAAECKWFPIDLVVEAAMRWFAYCDFARVVRGRFCSLPLHVQNDTLRAKKPIHMSECCDSRCL